VEWHCGFYPGSHPGEHQNGIAATFDQARSDFEAAWEVFLANRTQSTSRAIVSRGHGQVPNASMDTRSMSTTITFRSDGAGLRSHWSPAAWTTLLPASQRSPAVRFDY
jgi:hypothetical protein